MDQPPETDNQAVANGEAQADTLTDLSRRQPSAQFLKSIPIGFARAKAVLGLAVDDPGVVQLAMVNPDDRQTRDVLRRTLRCRFDVLPVDEDQITIAINQAYGQQSGVAQEFVERLDRTEVIEEVNELGKREDLLNVADRSPVIKLVNLVLFEAVQQEASDIHIQPYEDRLIVRMRIDGVLFDSFDLPRGVQDEVVSRIKVMARMNIAEKRLPQDGRATVQVGDRVIDLRVSSVPASHGERVVIRLLDKSIRLYTLGELGMTAGALEMFRRLIGVEHGLVLVTGPTGSGKSTTLYAALGEINSTERNIITLEDPIEYQLEGISQIQISDKKGMTFASGLKSVLRQDPDIVMIGEIRDHETAVMAIQASLTGHLVFSTLHTNDAASAVTRLLDLGIEPYLVSSSLVGVLAQRLVRRVCPQCSEPHEPSDAELSALRFEPDEQQRARFRKGAGCDACRGTGYHGRAGCFELLTVNDEIRKLVQGHESASAINDAAIRAGMRTLTDDGLGKVADGQTTLSEVMRVAMRAGF
ncbi:type II secretion system ATPase GspE [Mucisphaera calidilacus]|uniref:protein-secreting ATPase n=1 Tax=Mucisphaera calidilacus TaxID=2527982 RepID=A0A518BUG9_9BACT|nr:type II secretion system ATPase GspE [Mucisphaera calidilacus]QDU70606.1 Type II secretion system protein E [Mucisphaera calidilacus]